MNLEHLNSEQQRAVTQTEGPVMILAGAGSGKTRTLVSRIQYLMDDHKVSPYRILAVTFSNKAAREMRERVAAQSKVDLGALQVTTFHSFCARLLRIEAQYLGLSRNFSIYDASESKSIVKSILGKYGINQKELHPSSLQYYIEGLKNLGYYMGCSDEETLEDIDLDDEYFKFFREYETELHKSNAVDFGSLITAVLNLFENFSEVLERYQRKYQYILVDEYQDTNRAQFRLIKLLSQGTKNVCVVGDEDQSIYSWRGADIRNILDFESVFPKYDLIKLEQNYRSSKNIIEAASHVIGNNVNRKGKEMWTDNEQGESIRVLECRDDKLEAQFVGHEITQLIKGGSDPNEIAIFYRTNAQSRLIEDALRKIKLPYRVVAGIKFYERKEIKDLLCYLRILVNEKDALAITRTINTPVRGIGARTIRKIEDEAIKLNTSLWDMFHRINDHYDDYKHLRLSTKVKSGIRSFLHILTECQVALTDGTLPSQVYEKLLAESGYLEMLNSEGTHEAMARVENLDELSNAIKQYEEDEEEPSLVGFLETITLDSETETGEPGQGQISMMTIHGSKGLEYEYVFLVGAEETVFPSYRSLEDGEDAIEEERRLFYVAMTRAMRKLYICFAQGRMLWGSVRFNGPSRFIDEIPEDYFEWDKYEGAGVLSGHKKTRPSSSDYDDFSQETHFASDEVTYVIPETKATYKFPEGTNVAHQLYGPGKILSAEGSGGDEKVVVKFKDGTKKKFLVKFAPIERL
ncbi:MAG: ATP-dependent DNA helicase PcrA [Halobacteriovoraceae bacterium]|nr:ATP-dependent DNA helicase PcrA [Halobacteriovoraceae bacterium]|tara:strand:+ start:16920 stop:19160 length:2241 start_codon:yes stop_codon:yes gene_type:complete